MENVPGYVLHSRPWRETSLIVEAFTREHGRVGLVARGVRRAQSRFRGLLLPFHLLLLSWSGRGELPTLTGADAEGASGMLRGRALFSGFYLNELLLKLLPRNDAHPELFDDYGEALAGLGGNGVLDAVLRTFEKRLLDALGYGPTLDRAADTGAPVSPDRRYRYVAERGPVEVAGAGEGPVVSGRTLLALAGGELRHGNDRERTEARHLMRAILAPHLGPRPLGSRELFRRPASPAPRNDGGIGLNGETSAIRPILLGVNVDHVATLRQVRGTRYPDPVRAAFAAEAAGADLITIHLREDRRHIQERDVEILRATLDTRMNLEMAVTEEMLALAERALPEDCCLVPERREELTTEGGLDVAGQPGRIRDACVRLAEAGIRTSLFIDPEPGADRCGRRRGRSGHRDPYRKVRRRAGGSPRRGAGPHPGGGGEGRAARTRRQRRTRARLPQRVPDRPNRTDSGAQHRSRDHRPRRVLRSRPRGARHEGPDGRSPRLAPLSAGRLPRGPTRLLGGELE